MSYATPALSVLPPRVCGTWVQRRDTPVPYEYPVLRGIAVTFGTMKSFRAERAVSPLDGSELWVVLDAGFVMHREASDFLRALHGAGRSTAHDPCLCRAGGEVPGLVRRPGGGVVLDRVWRAWPVSSISSKPPRAGTGGCVRAQR